MASSRKQFYQEFEDVSAVDQQAKFAKIHALVASLSLMKTSGFVRGNHFDGQICDGKTNLKSVGFDTKLQLKLVEFHKKKEAVAISNCEMKASK